MVNINILVVGIKYVLTFRVGDIGRLSLSQINCMGLSPDTKLHVACVLPPISTSSGKLKGAIFGGSVKNCLLE